jgi:hypothetical protein
MKIVVRWVAVLLLVIGLGVAVEAAAGAGAGAGSGPARIDQLAVDAAAWAGDPHVAAVSWVEEPGGPEMYFGGVPMPGQPSTTLAPQLRPAQYLLEMTGRFPVEGVATAGSQYYSVLDVTVDAGSFAVVSAVLSENWAASNLSGAVETDGLTGRVPAPADVPSGPRCSFPQPVCGLPPCQTPSTTTSLPGGAPPPPSGAPWATRGACAVTEQLPPLPTTGAG